MSARNLLQRASTGTLAALCLGILLFGVISAWAADSSASPAVNQDPYAVVPPPLTVADCGRCHTIHFTTIRDHGGKHRFDCQECHEVFHAYNPLRNNYAALMPKCANCHQLPHGEKFVECLGCHDNPHAPRLLQSLQNLSKHCGECHTGPASELAQFPSAHTKQPCASCHSERHGRIPACAECHQPHFAGQAADTCLTCHPVHKPLQIDFTPTTDAKNCSTCHTEAYDLWTSTKSKHGQVNCTVCHTRHAMIPKCTDCHQQPHDPKMMARFKGCLDCHLNPHNPPTK